MNSEVVAAAREYLAPEGRTFWRWSDDGQWVVWADADRAIAHRHEIKAVLSRLSGRGLPPFGSVVLLLAACRAYWRSATEPQGPFTSFVRRVGAERDPSPLSLLDLSKDLSKVTALPDALRQTAAAKAALAESFFETCSLRRPMIDDTDILRALREGLPHGVLNTQQDLDLPLDLLLDDFKALEDGLRRLDPEALALRTKTSLDELPSKAPLEEFNSQQLRQLLSELRSDPELSGIARLAMDLLAAVHVPRRLSSFQELPVGGVSDISTRGPLDRLLLSELAHDSLTLSARVALNEALYLRREAPPRTPKGGRLILIDGSLRLWGLPRLFATAVGLSMAADTTPEFKLHILRLEGDETRTVNWSHRDGLIEHLQALCPSPFPRVAWQKAEQEWREMASTQDISETVLVTHPNVLEDPEVRPFLEPFRAIGLLVACVERNGRLQLSHLGPQGREILRTANLDLSVIGGSPKKAPMPAPLVDEERGPDIPAIFYARPFPLFLPYSHKLEQIRPCLKGGAVAYSKDGRLLYWPQANRGGQELSREVPVGRVCWLGDEEPWICMVTATQKTHSLRYLAVNLESGSQLTAELKAGQKLRGVFTHTGVLFLVFPSRVDAYDCRTAELLSRMDFADRSIVASKGRMIYTQGDWGALSFDGQSVRVDLVKLPDNCRGVLQFFDREGLDGPWVMDMRCRVFSTVTGEELRFKDSIARFGSDLKFSRDGHRVLYRDNERGRWLLDFKKSTCEHVYKQHPDSSVSYALGAPSLIKHIYSIGFDGPRRLLLHGKSGATRILMSSQHSSGQDCLQFKQTEDSIEKLSKAPELGYLIRSKPPEGTRLEWKTFQWSDGSQAFLDGRGLLHLKSSAKEVPELTLVLSPETPTAWTSDGRTCGSAYFLGNEGNMSADYILHVIQRFAERL